MVANLLLVVLCVSPISQTRVAECASRVGSGHGSLKNAPLFCSRNPDYINYWNVENSGQFEPDSRLHVLQNRLKDKARDRDSERVTERRSPLLCCFPFSVDSNGAFDCVQRPSPFHLIIINRSLWHRPNSGRCLVYLAKMADDDPGSRESRNDWEIIPPAALHHDGTSPASHPCAKEEKEKPTEEKQEQELQQNPKDEVSAVVVHSHEMIFMDYFAASSQTPTAHYLTSSQNKKASDVAADSTSGASELDWMEPSSPFRSCVLVTSEDDDSASRSCSDDSREGTGHQSPDPSILTETHSRVSCQGIPDSLFGKEARLNPGFQKQVLEQEFAAAFHDASMGVIEESATEPEETSSGSTPDTGKDGDSHWTRRFGSWLAEAGRANTFCSLAVAATFIGLIILGNGWHRFQLQYQKLRCRYFPKGKGLSQLMYQLIQIKESATNSRRIPASKVRNAFPDVLNNI